MDEPKVGFMTLRLCLFGHLVTQSEGFWVCNQSVHAHRPKGMTLCIG